MRPSPLCSFLRWSDIVALGVPVLTTFLREGPLRIMTYTEAFRIARRESDSPALLHVRLFSRQAGEPVMASMDRLLELRLKLRANMQRVRPPARATGGSWGSPSPGRGRPAVGEREGTPGLHAEGPGGDGADAGTGMSQIVGELRTLFLGWRASRT